MTTQETWPWRRMNESNAPAHGLLASLLEPTEGERWLDVGTGAGGLALELARGGAEVVGIDVAADGLAHAREAAAAESLRAAFEIADAAALPFEDALFDGVASAFGVIFASDPERAAAELGRVCRPGGRLGLTLMPRATRTGAMWDALLRHGHPGPHPSDWEHRLEELLGGAFELEVGSRESKPGTTVRFGWEDWLAGFAPIRTLAERLDDDAVAALRADLEQIEGKFEGAAPSFLVVLGRRR